MKYNCELCNYSTVDKSNINRHFKSKKHLAKSTKHPNEVSNKYQISIRLVSERYPKSVKLVSDEKLVLPETGVINEFSHKKPVGNFNEKKEFLCEFCGQTFKYSNNYYRHKKSRCEGKKIDKKRAELEREIENLKLARELDKKNSEIEMLKTEKNIYHTENEYHKKLSTNAGNIIGRSLSTLAYVMQNFDGAPTIKAIETDEFKRLVYEDNYGKKVDRRCKISDYDTSEILCGYNRNNKLTELLTNVIIKNYKKDNPADQCLWSSDTSRYTYVINDVVNNKQCWVTDKSGVKVLSYIINPVTKYVDGLLCQYTSDIHKKINNGANPDTYVNEILSSAQIRDKIRSNTLQKHIIKSITPHFYLRQLM